MDGLQHPSRPPPSQEPPYLRCLEYLPRMCPEPEHPGVGQLGRQAEWSLGEGPTPDLTRGQKTVSKLLISAQPLAVGKKQRKELSHVSNCWHVHGGQGSQCTVPGVRLSHGSHTAQGWAALKPPGPGLRLAQGQHTEGFSGHRGGPVVLRPCPAALSCTEPVPAGRTMQTRRCGNHTWCGEARRTGDPGAAMRPGRG